MFHHRVLKNLVVLASLLLALAAFQLRPSHAQPQMESPTRMPAGYAQVKKLMASDAQASDWFGITSLSGDTLAVSAYREDGGPGDPFPRAGAAYIFERDVGGTENWGEVKKLAASDAQAQDEFGISIALSGDTVVVGAWKESNMGAAYVYERDLGGPNNWGEAKKLTASDALGGDNFGQWVAISGDTIVVGAPGVANGGAVYIFERDLGGPGNWGEVVKRVGSDTESQDWFGFVVAIDGDTVVVGDPSEDGGPGDPYPNAGAMYVFERDLGGPGNWGEAAKLTASDRQGGDRFGFVSISGNTIASGAWMEDGGPGDPLLDVGAVYIFERDLGGPGNWGEAAKLLPNDAQAGDGFYWPSISGDLLAVGAFSEDGGPGDPINDAGAAYLFERNEGGPGNWGQTAKLSASDAEANDIFGVVSLDGDVLAVGAILENADPSNPLPDAGAVYMFRMLEEQTFLPVIRNCRYLYFDDFSNPNSGWPVGDDGNILLEYKGGEYHLKIRLGLWTAVARPNVTFTDYLVSADVRSTTLNEGSFGLAFDVSSDFNQIYTFEIDTNRNFWLWYLNPNGVWNLLRNGSSAALNPGLNSNRISVERNGDWIYLYANGVQISSKNQPVTGPLYVGVIGANSDEGPLDVRFDNFAVEALGCGLSGPGSIRNGSGVVITHPDGVEVPTWTQTLDR